jgi:hypothetical protein
MIAPLDAIGKAINTAAGAQALHDLARLVWLGHFENAINEDDAQRLSEQIDARRPQRVQIDGSLDGFARIIMGSITPIRSLETGSKTRGNVCTELSISERARRLVPQGFQADRRDRGSHTPSYSVIGNESFSHPERGGAEPITAPPGPRSLSSSDVDHGLDACQGEALQKDQTKETSHSTGYARWKNRQVFSLEADRGRTRSKSKRPLKRGPPGSTRLTWQQVKEIDDFAHVARSAGMPLNRMVTIRAPIGVSDADGKKAIRQIVSHIRQDFERNGLLLIGVSVYEKHPLLHAHILLHVPRGNGSLIAKRHEGKDGVVHVTPADEKGVEYVTKQRQRLSPDYEDVIKRRWISSKGGQIEGPRYRYTTAAQVLLARRYAPPPSIEIEVKATPAPTQDEPILLTVPPSPPTTNMVQLPLFDDLPQARADEGLPAMIREVREQKGLSQTAFAEDYLDIRQPHLANVERLHDRLSPARRRAARYHLERLAA